MQYLESYGDSTLVEEPPPIFIVGTGRSGMTLLGYVLDQHPEVVCISGIDLATMFARVEEYFRLAMPNDKSSTHAEEVCRDIAARTLRRHLAESRKRSWAHRSPHSTDHLDTLLRVYPSARFICLYREAHDTVRSLLEAC